jgi:hypothetical protein
MQTERRPVQAFKLLLVFVLVLGFPRAALADDDPRSAARSHYERGLGLVESGAYQAALAEFERAYEKSPHFAVLYNIGLCHVALGRRPEAVAALRTYLEQGGPQIPDERRKSVEAQLAELEAKFAEITITTERPGAVISVDGREVGRTPLPKPIRMPAGTHEISAAAEGAPRATRKIEVGESERRTIDFAFAPAPPPAAAAAAPTAHAERPQPPILAPDSPKPRTDTRESGPYRTVGYVLTAAGVAAGVGGFAHYFWNRSRQGDWESEHESLKNGPPSPEFHDRAVANNELADSIEGAQGVTVGLFVASGVLIAGGVSLIVMEPGSGASVAWRGTW